MQGVCALEDHTLKMQIPVARVQLTRLWKGAASDPQMKSERCWDTNMSKWVRSTELFINKWSTIYGVFVGSWNHYLFWIISCSKIRIRVQTFVYCMEVIASGGWSLTWEQRILLIRFRTLLIAPSRRIWHTLLVASGVYSLSSWWLGSAPSLPACHRQWHRSQIW